MRELRQFLYLDDGIVRQFLEQIEGGAFDEEAVRRYEERGQNIDEMQLSAEDRSVTLRQTAASRLDRLHRLLSDDSAIRVLESLDEDLWGGVPMNSFVELTGSISVPDILRNMAAVAGIEEFLPIIEMANDLMDTEQRIPTKEIREVREKLPVMSAAARQVTSRPVPCVIAVTSAPRFKLLARLSRTSLLSSIDDLQGEATVMGRIQRKLAKGQSEIVDEEVLGLPRPARRDRRRGGSAPLVKIGHPGAVLSPIAIWR